MEHSSSAFNYWWAAIPIAALVFFSYTTWKQAQKQPARLAFASLVLGLAGLLFCPLAPFAVYLGRKSSRANSTMNHSIVVMSRIGIILGSIGSAFLVLVLIMAGLYFYAWITNQYPY